jgi:YesN/AraC family two-component response regulator
MNENYILTLIDTLGEFIWGENNFIVTDIAGDDFTETAINAVKSGSAEEDTVYKMQVMEKRYALEQEIMEAVARGQINKAEMIMEGFSSLAFERRLTDQLRNIKNYCIIMNTLLRKAAENGGVHPIYIDSVSSDFAKRMESLTNISAVNGFMREMFRAYCTLVKRKASKHYSPIVQRAIITIDYDLTVDLSLAKLAKQNNVSASYFSTLFKKETGLTLTEFVNERRIEQAKKLLRKTYLQVQTVAQHCGIYDVHYFSKLFKKYTGKPPKEYRDSAF